MAWRRQRQKRDTEKRLAAIRSSPWASQSARNDQYLASNGVRAAIAQINDLKRIKTDNQQAKSKLNVNAQPYKPAMSFKPSKLPKPTKPEEDKSSSGRGRKRSASRGKQDKRRRSSQARPNYFTCVRITDAKILSSAREIQDRLTSGSPESKKLLIDVVTMHLTINLLHIKGEDGLKSAFRALELAAERIQSRFLLHPLRVKFQNISSFGSRVLYLAVDPKGTKALNHIKSDIEAALNTFGMSSMVKEFGVALSNPHLTLAKTNRKTNWQKMPEKLMEALIRTQEADYGSEEPGEVLLCRMGAPKGAFYEVLKRISIRASKGEGMESKLSSSLEPANVEEEGIQRYN
ncbi:hypothetical protein AAMO2058_001099500 [Amorphochlora amoebiformis]|eukprot:689454-Amorphochlora_amoeboformis.AAC.2